MKKLLCSILCLLLICSMVACTVPVTLVCQHIDADKNGVCDKCNLAVPSYVRKGDYIYFGEYPQTIKENSVTITETVDERGYYLGSDGSYYAKVVAMPYTSPQEYYIFSSGARVVRGETYYFKVEPIRWRILTTDGETAFLLCDSIIANHAYQSSIVYDTAKSKYYVTANIAPVGTYANNYKYSEIRTWLNETFYKTAFSNREKQTILTTTVDNSGNSTGYSSNFYSYVCEDTQDKVFLLSYRDVKDSAYGFASSGNAYDTARQMQTSDYSRATGVSMRTSSEYYGNGHWWLRSPSRDFSHSVYSIQVEGYAIVKIGKLEIHHYGVVPALQIQL